jgi:lipopolysaccharide transport system ATP-binding protein
MSGTVISVEKLGKKYKIGSIQGRYKTLRESIMGVVRSPFRPRREHQSLIRNHGEIIWALRDVSFEAKEGEVIGIIGRNGAGKSTLLKILSRITEPTEGRAIIRGRVGSMLEVGTGFHPELTGRENIYLNGAILGMRRNEIGRKFDEIVSFAEVEKFLDTPVKHYSSGMYVRLAFAVAAHLEPEILIVDEVLAVGDATFQKKCLGKMEGVAREGRTVLFVSHNMGAIVSLCNRCILIEKGSLVKDGSVSQVVAYYQSSLSSKVENSSDLSRVERYGTGKAKFISAKITPLGPSGEAQAYLYTGQDLKIEVRIKAEAEIIQANVALILYDAAGYRLIDANTALQGSFLTLRVGESARVEFRLRNVLLKPGIYLIGLWLGRGSMEDIDGITYVASVSVEADPGSILHSQTFPGIYQCRYIHHIEKVET